MKTKKRLAEADDERYAKIASDPKFRTIPQKERKLTIDERFKGMIGGRDPRFALNYSVDKRGRPLRKTASEDLRRFYRLEQGIILKLPTYNGPQEEDESDEDKEIGGIEAEGDLSSGSDGDKKIKIDLARGEGNIERKGPSLNYVTQYEKCEGRAELEKLRAYQIDRLKYYYAVVECDQPDTADSIYDSCNGIEYETSGTRIDLRFIPDDMRFEHAEPKEVANEVGDLGKYEPRRFDTSALKKTSAVRLTWDETDPDRVKLVQKAFEPEAIDSLDIKYSSLVFSERTET